MTCPRCQDRTVVGGFLPSPCPLCRPDASEPLEAIRADRDALAEQVWTLKREWDTEHIAHVSNVRDLDAIIVARTAERDTLAAERDQLRAEVERVRAELDHATCEDGDHLSKASRRMVETVMGEREALREKLRNWRNWSDEIAPPFGLSRDRSDNGQRTAISERLASVIALWEQATADRERLTAERDAAIARAEKAEQELDAFLTPHALLVERIERDTAARIAAYVNDHYVGRDDDPHVIAGDIEADIRAGAWRDGGDR